jgi:hypothetical protein
LENKLLIFLKQLIIYPTHATFGAGKINYAPLCEVNRLYEEHEQILEYFAQYFLQILCTKALRAPRSP